MKHLQVIAILIFCLGLLVGNTSAQDEQNPSYDVAGFPTDSSAFAAGAGVPFAADAGVPFAADAGVPFAADAGVPFAADAGVPFAADAGVPFAADAGVPTGSSAFAAAMYTTTAPPATQQNTLLTYDVAAYPPSAVYYAGSYVPWTSFYPKFKSTTPMFWVSTRAGWGVYATCPLGGWARYLMYVPYTGALKLYELYPDDTVRFYNYGWSARGYKYLWFIADTPGRHISFITVTDRPSNYVTIDVF